MSAHKKNVTLLSQDQSLLPKKRNLDPQWRKVVDRAYRFGYGQLHLLDIHQTREIFAGSAQDIPVPDRIIDLPDGPKLNIFRPTDPISSAQGTPTPALLFVGGTGYIAHLPGRTHAWCQHMADLLSAPVVIIEHRLAPEFKFPIPYLDVKTSVYWVIEHAAELNIDLRRIALCGESAGGSLTTALVHDMLNSTPHPICHHALVYPMLWHAYTDSKVAHQSGYLMDTAFQEWAASHYLNNWSERYDVRVSPYLFKGSLNQLPETTMIQAQYCPLRDECNLYLERLEKDGAPYSGVSYPGVTHAFLSFYKNVPQAQAASHFLAKKLKKAFSKSTVKERMRSAEETLLTD